MTIQQLYIFGKNKLADANIQDADLKAKYILCDLLDIDVKQWLVSKKREEKADEKFVDEYTKCIEKVCANTPYQYVVGKADFLGNKFYVDENVLIPRQDSYLIYQKVLEKISELQDKNGKDDGENGKLSLLEIGTGSGCLCISCALHSKNCTYLASDISKGALSVATKNYSLYEKEILANGCKISFVESDLFANIPSGKCDIIFSNPPYIPYEEESMLDLDVLKEPRIALFADNDGLAIYDRILSSASSYLSCSGYIVFEIGYNQGEKLVKLADNYGFECEIFNDFSDNNRVAICKYKKKK